MSDELEDYVWKNGVHHTRGADIQLPVVSKDDSVIIVHKSAVTSPVVVWEASDYLSASDLRTSAAQILWANHEIYARVERPNIFNVYIGQKTGIVSTGEDGIIAASYFPAGIAPTGAALVADLDGVRLQEVGNVVNTIPFAGYQVEWRAGDLDKWKPSVAWGYTGIESKPEGTIVRKRINIYETEQTKFNHLGNVHSKRQYFGDGIEHFGRTGDMIGWFPSTSKWELTGSLIATTDIPWTDPGDTWYEPYGSIATENDPNVETPNDRYNLHWETSTGKWEFSTLLKDILDYNTYTWPNDYNKLASLQDVAEYVLRPGDTTPVPGQLLTWDKPQQSFRNYSYDTWNHSNVYAGSATITDSDDDGYSGGYTLDNLHQWYGWPDSVDPDDETDDTLYPGAGAAWMMYWDSTLYQKHQDPDTEDPHGAFNIGVPMSWEPQVKIDMLTAPDNSMLKVGTNSSTGDREWKLEPTLLSELGKVTSVTADGFPPSDGTYLVWVTSDDSWHPRDVVGGPQTAAQVKYLDTSLYRLEADNGVLDNTMVSSKLWGTNRVPRNCTLTGFSCLQPKDGYDSDSGQPTNCGPGYTITDNGGVPPADPPQGSGVMGLDYLYRRDVGPDAVEDYHQYWRPGGVRLYRKRIDWGDDPGDGEDYPDYPADEIALISDAFDGSVERFSDDSYGEFTRWQLMDKWWRDNENSGDPWLSLNVPLVKGDQLLVEFVLSPYYTTGFGVSHYQRAACTWRIEGDY